MKDSPNTIAACPAKGFLPVYGESVEILILGSFPGRQSLVKKEYYGNPQNHFWHIIEALYNIDRNLPYSVRISQLTDRRIALWDVLSGCCRKGSADVLIREPVFNDLAGFLREFPTIRLIALNGSSSGRYYHQLAISAVPAVILPSTSPANTRFTLDQKVRAWSIIRTQPPVY
ncbi:MAG: DNA-deoxyinosine glycosylase [Methanoregula sp.]|nr:DNA-deoxyinosine glycosylase [Methanoregula sp.]